MQTLGSTGLSVETGQSVLQSNAGWRLLGGRKVGMRISWNVVVDWMCIRRPWWLAKNSSFRNPNSATKRRLILLNLQVTFGRGFGNPYCFSLAYSALASLRFFPTTSAMNCCLLDSSDYGLFTAVVRSRAYVMSALKRGSPWSRRRSESCSMPSKWAWSSP